MELGVSFFRMRQGCKSKTLVFLLPFLFSENFVFLIKDYKGTVPFKHDWRFL